MLETIKIIALIQGFFVLTVLFANRKSYKKVTLWLLIGCLLAVIFYILGDDGNNLFITKKDWFLFDKTLFVTFLFLFFKYDRSGAAVFSKRDFLLFTPNVVYLTLEIIEIIFVEGNIVVEFFEILVEMVFISYLLAILFAVISNKAKHWLIYFVIPITVLFTISFINDILKIISLPQLNPVIDKNFNSYLLLIVSFLFYFIAFKLLTQNKEILAENAVPKYRNSNLTDQMIAQCKSDLVKVMEEDKLYLDGKLSIQDISDALNVPRQYISEVLNEHMNISFQDFINKYRVEEFIDRLKEDQNKHFTLMAIATDVGFNSKSSFNAIFKKVKGLTPTEYMKGILKNP